MITWQDSYKSREAKWVVLEEALFEWEQRYKAGNNPLTGAILHEKAAQFWRSLPCYQDLPLLKLSEGWITRFKNRHNIRQQSKHDEAGSADISEVTAEIMAEIREASASYNPDDTYNMDETGYFWKMVPDRSLETERTSGLKQNKARVTAALTCNATRTRKLPI